MQKTSVVVLSSLINIFGCIYGASSDLIPLWTKASALSGKLVYGPRQEEPNHLEGDRHFNRWFEYTLKNVVREGQLQVYDSKGTNKKPLYKMNVTRDQLVLCNNLGRNLPSILLDTGYFQMRFASRIYGDSYDFFRKYKGSEQRVYMNVVVGSQGLAEHEMTCVFEKHGKFCGYTLEAKLLATGTALAVLWLAKKIYDRTKGKEVC